MKLVIDISEHEWEYLNKLVANGDQLGHYERLLTSGEPIGNSDKLKEPKTEWIPCSERLPEKTGTYFVTRDFGTQYIVETANYTNNLYKINKYDFSDKKRAGWYAFVGEYGYYEEVDCVTAWQPLPEPYQSEENMSEVKIKMYSPYEHLKKWWAKDGEKYIPCYNDSFVRGDIEQNAIALLIEPRSLQPKVYEHIEKHYNDFKYIFTHDSKLLNTLPNAKLIIWGGVWDWADMKKDFAHPVSMVASPKGISDVRIARRELAFELKGKIDTYGTFDGGERADTKTIYGKYPYSVVIENYIDDYWLTEKICNCFSCNTIPIYYGAKKVDELFNAEGIIHCHSIDEVRDWVDRFTSDRHYARFLYNMSVDAIKDNRERVKEYEDFNEWFMRQYEKLLGGIL